MKKNPFMSAWLSDYHRTARAAQEDWAKEVTRQQQAMMKTCQAQWTEAVNSGTEAWIDMWMPWASGKSSPKRRR
ncbi:hypothetical protein [Mangrovicoccus sp. HB161399]|uniref:hypothetical protein n=1 Tax=Mangrovicoccus sp. HB161399 TaxID=2720392 RepID=UPI001552FC11|nr:hypothetical protein [Mangrovicoccus sp. HB161399]